MKKLAIIGTVVAIGALGIVGTAVAKPTAMSSAPSGMTPAEYHALIVRSEALNQKYGIGQKAEQANVRGKLEEIGAWAVPSTSKQKPAIGMTKAEYRALLLRSEALNQKYGLGQTAEQANVRGKLEEIGAWAVPSTSKQKPAIGMTKAEYRALLLRSEALNQKYGLGVESLTLERGDQQRFGSGNPLSNVDQVAPSTSTDSTGIEWNTVGIGMGALLGFAALVGTALFSVRHRGHLGTS